jgi:hypothetical protein
MLGIEEISGSKVTVFRHEDLGSIILGTEETSLFKVTVYRHKDLV